MAASVEEALRSVATFRALSPEDRARLADIASVRTFDKGDHIFTEGDPSEYLYTVLTGRVKVIKAIPSGKEVILEIFGPGDPLGAVVAYEGRPYPASAVAIESSSCLLMRRAPFFGLLERHPTLVRGFLVGLAQRIVELTRRIPEVAGGRVETRFAHLFLKLADKMGRRGAEGVLIPMALSRQDLADLTGTTVETCIRIMSRWGKEGLVRTEKDGFVVCDRGALEKLALS
ncbi:MAG TPA: Crp/Fnr family transcriptional regulator [Vicinamibacteria bacterium]|nr:Crp/Fnr family transcriptional regulator [Vicinamibacteria bacterium]